MDELKEESIKEKILVDKTGMINEALLEGIHKRKGCLGQLKGVICEWKDSTRNDHYYSQQLWKKVFNLPWVQEAIRTKTLFGEADHPEDRLEASLTKAAVVLSDYQERPEEKDYVGTFDILDTPCGRIVKTLAEYGCELGVSSRGKGSLNTLNGRNVVDETTYTFGGFDIVALPAVKKARQAFIPESVQFQSVKDSIQSQIDSSKSIDELNIMKDLLNESVYGNLVDSINSKIKSLSESIISDTKKSNTDLNSITRDLRDAYSQIKELKERLDTIEEISETRQATILSYENALEDYKQALSAKDSLIGSLKTQLSDLSEEKTNSSESVDIGTEIDADVLNDTLRENIYLSTEIKNLKEELQKKAKLLEELQNSEQAVAQYSNTITELQETIKRKTCRLNDIESSYDKLKEDFDSLQSDNQNLMEEYDKSSQALTEITNKYEFALDKLNTVYEQYEDSKKELSDVLENYDSVKSSLDISSSSLREVKHTLREMRTKDKESTETIQQLSEKLQFAEEDMEHVSESLESVTNRYKVISAKLNDLNERYLEVKDNLKKSKLNSKSVISKLQTENEELRRNLQETSDSYIELSDVCEKFRDKHHAVEQVLEDANNNYMELTQACNKLRSKLKTKEREIKENNQITQSLQHEIDSLESTLLTTSENLREAESDLDYLAEKYQELQMESESNRDISDKYKKLEEDYQELEIMTAKKIAGLNSKISKLEETNSELSENLLNVRSGFKDLTEEFNEQEQLIQKLQESKDSELIDEITDLKEKLEFTEGRLSESDKDLDIATEELYKVSGKLTKVTNKYTKVKTELDELRLTNEQLQNELNENQVINKNLQESLEGYNNFDEDYNNLSEEVKHLREFYLKYQSAKVGTDISVLKSMLPKDFTLVDVDNLIESQLKTKVKNSKLSIGTLPSVLNKSESVVSYESSKVDNESHLADTRKTLIAMKH